jgi:hypothetical protein
VLKDEVLVPDALHRLQNRCKWDLQTGANTHISTSAPSHKSPSQFHIATKTEITTQVPFSIITWIVYLIGAIKDFQNFAYANDFSTPQFTSPQLLKSLSMSGRWISVITLSLQRALLNKVHFAASLIINLSHSYTS